MKSTRDQLEELRRGQLADKKESLIRFVAIQTALDKQNVLIVQTIQRVIKETIK